MIDAYFLMWKMNFFRPTHTLNLETFINKFMFPQIQVLKPMFYDKLIFKFSLIPLYVKYSLPQDWNIQLSFLNGLWTQEKG